MHICLFLVNLYGFRIGYLTIMTDQIEIKINKQIRSYKIKENLMLNCCSFPLENFLTVLFLIIDMGLDKTCFVQLFYFILVKCFNSCCYITCSLSKNTYNLYILIIIILTFILGLNWIQMT